MLRDLINLVFMPPAFQVWMGLLGLILFQRFPKVSRGLIAVSVLSLYLVCSGWFASILKYGIQASEVVDLERIEHDGYQAIVILSSEKSTYSPEFVEHGQAIVGASLERVRYGAYLHRKTNLPILVSGGLAGNIPPTLAQAMVESLDRDFRVGEVWVEDKSNTTWENALYSKEVLAEKGINKIVLVTHAIHMTRSVEAFEAQGFQVLPAATVLGGKELVLGAGFYYWLPNLRALNHVRASLHEYIGLYAYRILYY